ncbi:hypothetical protein [Actinoplanes sp. GCM10030250]|uniref:hypothetical protein n=1 Tax=Actinoplanes sp. GCM10030250 TaxID=3273376 RepID=UPI003623EF38
MPRAGAPLTTLVVAAVGLVVLAISALALGNGRNELPRFTAGAVSPATSAAASSAGSGSPGLAPFAPYASGQAARTTAGTLSPTVGGSSMTSDSALPAASSAATNGPAAGTAPHGEPAASAAAAGTMAADPASDDRTSSGQKDKGQKDKGQKDKGQKDKGQKKSGKGRFAGGTPRAETASVRVSSPGDGATLSGTADVSGTAYHPDGYQVWLLSRHGAGGRFIAEGACRGERDFTCDPVRLDRGGDDLFLLDVIVVDPATAKTIRTGESLDALPQHLARDAVTVQRQAE